MAQVFISYTSADRTKADRLRTALKTANIDVWWDQKLIPGEVFPRAIADEIKRAPCTLVLCSKQAMTSRWVLAEAVYARERMIPILIDPEAELFPPMNIVEGAKLMDWETSPPAPEFELLLTKIKNAFAAALAHEPASPSNLIKSFCGEHNRALGQLIHEELQSRWDENRVTPPFLASAKEFLADQAWHEWVKDRLAEAKKAIGDDPQLGGLQKLTAAVDCAADYPAILARIGAVASETNLKTVAVQLSDVRKLLSNLDARASREGASALTAELLARIEDLRETRKRLESLQRALSELAVQANKPEFRRCFLITGFPGAGKTHLIATLLDENAGLSKDPAALFILLEDNGESIPLDLLLLKGAQRASGDEWQTLQEFDSFLEHTYGGMRAVFVIDDLERWQSRRPRFADELADLIYSRNLHSFFWIVTLNPARYDEVARNDRRWRELGWRRPWREPEEHPNLSGWLDLDQRNRTKHTGLAILRRQIPGYPAEEARPQEIEGLASPLALDALNENELAEAGKRHLASPWLAWIMLDLRDKLRMPIQHSVSLNFVEFIERYQELRIGELVSEYRDLGRHLEQAIWLIAGLLATTRELRPYFNRTRDYLVSQSTEGNYDLSTSSLAELVISGLADVNLLAIISDREEGGVRRIEPKFEPLWEFHIARRIARGDGTQKQQLRPLVKSIEKWVENTKDDAIGAEGVLEFLLLQIVGSVREDDILSTFQKGLWLEPLGNKRLPGAAPWFAAPKAPKPAQEELAEWALRGGVVPSRPRDLYGLMHFCAEALPDVLNVPNRLKLLQPKFQEIHAASLRSYYLYLVRRLFAGVTGKDPLRRAMQFFAGCEVMGIAGELASVSIGAINRIVADLDGTVQFMMVFLQSDAPAARREAIRLASARPPEIKDTHEEHCYFYREWLIQEFLKGLIASEGVKSYDLLAANNWFKPDWQAPSVHYMQKHFNLTLGHWYRSKMRDETTRKKAVEQYLGLIQRLVEMGSRARIIAHFLIRHSEVTEARESFKVADAFHPFLRKIYSDPRVDLPDGLYRENLPDFEQLRQERLRKARQIGLEARDWKAKQRERPIRQPRKKE